MKKPSPEDFGQWYTELVSLAAGKKWDIGPAKYAGFWGAYFDAGLTPEEALEDDMGTGGVKVPYYGD
jgi:hypothetical protein